MATTTVGAVNPAPTGANTGLAGVIPKNDFASKYRSVFTATAPVSTAASLEELKYLNCCYLSTEGKAPTIVQLKQHAQSLVILLKHLCGSTTSGIVNNAALTAVAPAVAPAPAPGAGAAGAPPVPLARPVPLPADLPVFRDHEAFDFLNDLTIPYKNDRDRHHNLPLVSLLNTLEPDPKGDDRQICPLHENEPRAPNQPALPFATHATLLQHADEVLELLDHEYSAKGGLLGILPPKDDVTQRALAESTFLGQMILYIQRLVHRLHDLERQHANAMDVIGGEALVPSQTLSLKGPEGRAGRRLVYPQDRFVLANAGEDLWQYLTDEFDKKEKIDEQVRSSFLRMGVEGEALWIQKGGKEYSRGLTAIDITTRYYRLRNHQAKTVFVVPAHKEHPGVATTRTMESQPTVVSVVKPTWPERASVWEQKHRDELDELRVLRRTTQSQATEIENKTTEIEFLDQDIKLKDGLIRKLTVSERELRALHSAAALPGPQGRAILNNKLREIDQKQRNLDAEKATLAAAQTQLATDQNTLTARIAAVNTTEQANAVTHRNMMTGLQARQAQLDAQYTIRMNALEAEMQLQGQNGIDLANRFKAQWVLQIEETQVLIDFLNSPAAVAALGNLRVPGAVEAAAKAQAAQRIANAGL